MAIEIFFLSFEILPYVGSRHESVNYESNSIVVVRVNLLGCLCDTSSPRAAVLVPDTLELENRVSL
jgi:hypothetical protein